MDIKRIMEEVNAHVHIHDNGIDIEYISHDKKGFEMDIKLHHMDKFLGMSEVARIINKALKKHKTCLKGLSMKTNKRKYGKK
jgi:hypothetical protein